MAEQDNSPVTDEHLDHILVLMVDQYCESLEHYSEVRNVVLDLVRSGGTKYPAEAYDIAVSELSKLDCSYEWK